ncbi:hypothetical protein CDD83_10279 [Cordyceps sp. RAO-2017]|nr:hypothetical protein CDD83_10279 [Cordyceps sp. RAO-2017]
MSQARDGANRSGIENLGHDTRHNPSRRWLGSASRDGSFCLSQPTHMGLWSNGRHLTQTRPSPPFDAHPASGSGGDTASAAISGHGPNPHPTRPAHGLGELRDISCPPSSRASPPPPPAPVLRPVARRRIDAQLTPGRPPLGATPLALHRCAARGSPPSGPQALSLFMSCSVTATGSDHILFPARGVTRRCSCPETTVRPTPVPALTTIRRLYVRLRLCLCLSASAQQQPQPQPQPHSSRISNRKGSNKSNSDGDGDDDGNDDEHNDDACFIEPKDAHSSRNPAPAFWRGDTRTQAWHAGPESMPCVMSRLPVWGFVSIVRPGQWPCPEEGRPWPLCSPCLSA